MCTKCDDTLYTREYIPCSECNFEEWEDFILEHPGTDRLICDMIPGLKLFNEVKLNLLAKDADNAKDA